ncbi:MAG: hypothetical protein Q7T26_13110 [Dehalococcoidia bacterium]|nr:hypothetical protein [Dehalococcoidia bacterium]
MFDVSFYQTVLPERVTSECRIRPEDVPVVLLHLANGMTMDLCHIVHLADTWLAVRYFRDTKTCEEMDVAYVPYELVTLVTLSLHRPEDRPVGFRLEGQNDGIGGTTTSKPSAHR